MRATLLLFPSLVSVFAIVVACGGSDDGAPPAPSSDGGTASSSSGGNGDAGGTSSSSSSSGGPSGVYVAAQPGQGTAFCDASWGKLSAKLGQCCSADDQKTSEYSLAAGVLALAVQQCGTLFERAIGEGHVETDLAAAQACYDAYGKAVGTTCTPNSLYGIDPNIASDPAILAGLEACKKVFRGTAAENAPCAYEIDCLDGLTCVGYTKDSDGVCKKPPALTEACGEGASDGGGLSVTLNLNVGDHPKCATGAYCNKTCLAQSDPGGTCSKDEQCAGGKKCHAGTCGDAGDSDANGSCKNNDDCKTGLYCQGATSGQLGTCQPKLSDGAACSSTFVNPECKGRCEKPEGGTSGTCKSLCGSG